MQANEGAIADASTSFVGGFGAFQGLGLSAAEQASATSAADNPIVSKATINAVPCTDDKGNAVVRQTVVKDSRWIHAEFGEESAASLEQHSRPVALSKALADDHAVLTERHLSAATEQQIQTDVHVQLEQLRLASDGPANEELSGNRKLRLMEQKCCMAQEQSKKLDEHVRYVQYVYLCIAFVLQ